MATKTATRPATSEYSTSRPLRASELRRIAYSLCAAIALDGDALITMSEPVAATFDRLRNAADSLAAVADHVCNDHRYWDDDERDPNEPATSQVEEAQS